MLISSVTGLLMIEFNTAFIFHLITQSKRHEIWRRETENV
jgi:hypothetical protein